MLRSILKDGSAESVTNAVAYGKRVKLYPLSQAASPPATVFVDTIDEVFDATIPYDVRYEGVFSPPYYEGTHWALPAYPDLAEQIQTNYADSDSYAVDSRGVTYSMAFFSAKHLGAGQYYLMTIVDNDGRALNGSKAYRLRVPANPPVTQYWSATAYDRATHALIRGLPRSSRSSQSEGIQRNADGSVDVYFGPKPPDKMDANWVPTSADGKFEMLFRFYGTQKPLFDKTWRLPDIARTAN